MIRLPPSRRHLLSLIGSGALLTGAPRALAATCRVALPEETEGPYPADGSHMGPPPGMASMPGTSNPAPNALKLKFILRSDLRTSGGTGHVAQGVPLSLRIQLTGAGCRPLGNHAVYIWHCTQAGDYSLYTLPDEDFLRGVQVSDSGGYVTFHTIFPGCYDGRMPHIHVEVYPSLDMANDAQNKLATTQFAFDPVLCAQVYGAAKGYEASVANLNNISFATDNVFGDNTPAELAAQTLHISGGVTDGFAATVILALGDGAREPARMGPPPGGFGGGRPPLPPRS